MVNPRRASWTALASWALLVLSCGGSAAPCREAADCVAGEACVSGKCEPVAGFSSTSAGLTGGLPSTGTSSAGRSASTGAGPTASNGTGRSSASGSGSSGSTNGAAPSSAASSNGSQNGSGNPSGSGSGSNSAGTTGSAGSTSAGASSSSGGTTGAAITCAAASAYTQNGGACGTERWSVKTGTDNDVQSVGLSPVPATIAQLVALPVPANQGAACNRNPPAETTLYQLTDVNLHFHSLESDSDYHIVASDSAGNSMIVEVPYPACVGHDACSGSAPFLCEVTHARANADVFSKSGQDAVGTVVGVGFFDYKHGQTGVAPNAIELHPVLAICFTQGCDPFAGY